MASRANIVLGKTLSHNNQTIFAQLESLIANYSASHSSELKNLLLKVEGGSEQQLSRIWSQLQRNFNLLLMRILVNSLLTQRTEGLRGHQPGGRIEELKGALEAICGSQENRVIKRAVVITFVQNILECLGVGDLGEVLGAISQQICSFGGGLEEVDQYKLLRIINHLLKRVSKTEDYHIRGQLHLTLTKFLPLCHDSGFHYRALPARSTDWEKQIPDNQEGNIQQELSYQFYQQFWELQKYFTEASEINVEVGGKGKEPAVGLRLRRIEQTLREVDGYFRNHPAKEVSDYYSQPLKFLKNYNLLTLQLGDPFFRKIIMLQALIFTFSLNNQSARAPIQLTEVDKKTLIEIDNLAAGYLKGDGTGLYQSFQKILTSELYWMDLKDNWKDRKKGFFKRDENVEEEKGKKHVDLQKRKQEVRRQINDKLKIDGSNLLRFLENQEPISLQQTPTSTSFSYFFGQTMSCLASFDFQAGKQTEFETRSEYNMFEWKAMRSLYRQNIREIWNADKSHPKLIDYRLLSLMQRKEDDLSEFEDPKKKIKEE